MGDRRRRTGYRAADLSTGMQAALDAEVDRLSRLDDPIAQVRAVGDFFAALDIELERVTSIRMEAIVALRGRGMTYQRITDVTDLSRPRVAEIARAAKAGGRAKKKQ